MNMLNVLGLIGFLVSGILVDCCFSLRRRIINLERDLADLTDSTKPTHWATDDDVKFEPGAYSGDDY